MKNRFTLGLLLVALIFSCKPDDEPTPSGTGDPGDTGSPNDTTTVVEPGATDNYLNGDSEYIFDQSKLHTFELNLPVESLQKINSDPAAEEYVEGSLTFEGETIQPVGIRYKGSIGAFVGCLSGINWADPSGFKTCTKLSMKIKINWNDSDDKFFGLKKLQFHSMNNDDSQMRDRMGYHFFREMGIPAPRAVHARLVINGEYSGVYALIEQIDGRFTRQNFEDGKGNLYKEIWPLHSNGNVFSDNEYLQALETNEDEEPSVEMIRTFGQEIIDAADDTALKAVIEKWMNVDEIISYAAVDRTIRNDDGAFHWYCNGNVCAPHNFFWYEEPSEKTMHLIPWDLDNAFENIISNANPVTPIADEWGETRNNCNPFRSGFFGITQKSAACDKLIGGWAKFNTEYETQRERFKNGPMSAAQVDLLMNKWSEQIRNATEEANEKYSDAISISKWESAMQEFKNQMNFARNQ